MKGYLYMNPVNLTVCVGQGLAGPVNVPVAMDQEVLAVLCVYRTKKAARKVHGRKAELMEVQIPEGNLKG